jgi:hypothetical protein
MTRWLVAWLAVVAGGVALAQEPPDDELPAIDVVEQMVSEQVRETARQIDAFFGDVRHIDEPNQTELRIGIGLGLEDRRSPDVLGRFRARLVLPVAERRLALFLGRSDEADLPSDRVPEGFEEERLRRDASIGLRFAVRQDVEESLGLTGGVRIGSFRPQLFAGPRYRRTWFYDQGAITSTSVVRWYTRDGWAAGTDVDLERALGRFMLFRLTPHLEWAEPDPGFGFGLGANLFQDLGDRRIINYFATSHFRSTRPRGLDVASLGLRYRQSAIRDWIFFEVQPAVMFRDANDHDPTGRLVARVELVFGGPPRVRGK